MQANHLYNLTRMQLTALLGRWGFAAVHAARLWNYVYRQDQTDWAAMHELPAKLRSRLDSEASLAPLKTLRQSDSTDALTRKFLLEISGGQSIETVLMRYRDRVTACLSSQAGCALGCVFCATGQMGFSRNLTAGEIVAQALHIDRLLAAKAGQPRQRLRNVVLMGMGEPLLNYDAVLRAVDILRDSSGLAIAGKRITLSTVGVVPGIVRLADEARPCSLAVSLHAATQEERAALVPAAFTWPLNELIEACRYYTHKLERKIFFEWTLIAGATDTSEQAHALAHLVHGIPAQINLIPLNPTAGYVGAPGRSESAVRFQAILREHGLPVTIRQRRGIDIAAGCGQLASAN